MPGYAAESWYGLYAPAGTPRALIELLNAAATKGAQSENFKKRVEDQGLAISTGTPEALQVYIDGEQKRWAGVVKAANLAPR